MPVEEIARPKRRRVRSVLKVLGVIVAVLGLAFGAIAMHDMTNWLRSGRTASDIADSSSRGSRLARVADRATVQVTHYGRKTGTPYEVTTWFMVDGDVVYLPTANRGRQWVRNVLATPRVELEIAGERFDGTVTPVTDPAGMAQVYELLTQKYWGPKLADRVGSLIGDDPRETGIDPGEGGFFRVDPR